MAKIDITDDDFNPYLLFPEKQLIDDVDQFTRRWEEARTKKKKAVVFVHDPMSAQSCSVELTFDMAARTLRNRKDVHAVDFLKLDYSVQPLRMYLEENHGVTMAPMCLLAKDGRVFDRVEGEMPAELKKKIDKLATEDTPYHICGINFLNLFSK